MPWISVVGDWALSWTAGNEKLQIAFVMMIFPLIMNGLQYYIIDSFIKKSIHEDDDDDLSPDNTDRRRGRFNQIPSSPDADFDSGDEAEDDSDAPRHNTKMYHGGKLGEDLQREYDPDVDGDVPTIVGSSSSQTKIERTDN
ncbi:hypothetical protein Golomagni_08188 [Golovinomyces magnicellulatus]|nr:hypothetical protein Golomagni_08188 [Golovinomyces magnicellulatus]